MEELAHYQNQQHEEKHVYESVLSPLNPTGGLNGIQSHIDLELYHRAQPGEEQLYNDSPCKDLSDNLLKALLKSPEEQVSNVERDLGQKFSKALQRYIKREVTNALVKNQQYYSSPTQIKSTKQTHEGLTDMTFDTILGGR